MSSQSKNNNILKSIRHAVPGSANLSTLKTSPNQFVKSHASFSAGVFSLVVAALVVWVWQITSSPGQRADIANSPDISNGTSLNSNVSSEQSVSSTSGSSNVSVQKDGTTPATVTVNGKEVKLPNDGSVHKSVGGTNVEIHVHSQSTNSGAKNSDEFNDSYSNSNAQVESDSQSYISGGNN